MTGVKISSIIEGESGNENGVCYTIYLVVDEFAILWELKRWVKTEKPDEWKTIKTPTKYGQ